MKKVNLCHKNNKLSCLINFIWLYLISLLIIHPSSSSIAETQAVPSISVQSKLVTGLSLPLGVYNAGDRSGRLFILEQTGLIKIVKNGQVLANPFLDIRNLLPCGPGNSSPNCGERGLLGLAFHPNYSVNGFFFINYTRKPDGATVIARYSVSGNPDIANQNSRIEFLVIGQPYANHNGGHLGFGKDNYLYIGMGDGGSAGDPLNNAQNLNNLLGKMLRIDVDTVSPGKQYALPPGNVKDEIWAMGLRNPWFWSFDRLNGDLYLGDVGQASWEEINFRRFIDPPGANFGWSCLEGTHDYNLTRFPCNTVNYMANTIQPIFEYSHSEGQAVTGGYVYRGDLYPSLYGRYFYADYITGVFWSSILENTQPISFSTPVQHLDEDFLVSCFGEGEDGELYICDFTGGTIRHLQDSQGAPPNLTGSWFRSDLIYADLNDVVNFQLHLINSGGKSQNPLKAVVSIPLGLSYISNSAAATTGLLSFQNPDKLVWDGVLDSNVPVEITFQVVVNSVKNNEITQAQMSGLNYPSMLIKHALLIPRPNVGTTREDFILPGTQPGSLIDPVMLPASCDVCHTALIFDSWQGSMMSQSGRDPLFWAALEVANHDAPGVGELCIRCHTPKGWLEGRSTNPNGSNLLSADLDAGVACEVCHRAVDPVPSNNPDDQAILRDSAIRASIPAMPTVHMGDAMLILDTEDFRRGPFNLGTNFNYHPNQTFRTDFLGGNQANVVARSRLCGTCHNVDNPILSWDPVEQEYLPNVFNTPPSPIIDLDQLFAVETTFEEWLNSDYSASTACQDCHMPRKKGYGAEDFFNPPLRDCGTNGCLPQHEFIGGNTWIPTILLDERWRLNRQDLANLLNLTVQNARANLQKAADVTVTELAGNNFGQLVSTVRVTNLTGHKLPTGYAEGRRMWLEIKAFDSQGNQVYSTCSYDSTTGQLTIDPNCTVFEIKQAVTPKLVAALGLDIQAGESFHFVLNNSVNKDNRIPPAGFTAEALIRRSLQPVENGLPNPDLYNPGENYFEKTYVFPNEATQITAILRYQTTSKEYIDFLRDNGGVDAQTMYDLWADLKSPPEIIAWGSFPINTVFLPFTER